MTVFASACERLLHTDGPSGRTGLYLRLLYSRSCAELATAAVGERGDELPGRTRGLLESIDWEALAVERSARLGALNRALASNLAPLYAAVDASEAKHWLADFADTEPFWSGAGRSLGEAFALFVARSSSAPPVVRALARLAGVMSGLVEAPASVSPWPDARKVHRSAPSPVLAEAFTTSWPLLRQDGSFATVDHLPELESRAAGGSPFRVTVAVVEGDHCVVSCRAA